MARLYQRALAVLSTFITLTVPIKRWLTTAFRPLPVSNMLNKLHGQPESYDKKYACHFGLQREPTNQSVERSIDLDEPLVLAHTVLFARQMGRRARSP